MTLSDSTLRVLHCSEMIKGGTATYLRELLPFQDACAEIGSIHVLIPKSQTSYLPAPTNVHIETFNDGAGGRLKNAILMANQALNIIRHENIDIVHLHGTFAGAVIRPLLAVACRNRNIRVFYCAHGWAWDRAMSKNMANGIRYFEYFMSLFTDRIICISEYDRRTAVETTKISPKKLVVVRNAVTSQPPAAIGEPPIWPAGKRRLLFVGRFDYQKGVDVFLSALKIMGDAVHGVIVGASVLEDTGEALEFPANSTVVGWLKPGELETCFAAAELLVAPSRWEGFGLIVAEAMRAGLPVVASKLGGLCELVEDGVTGVLVPAESPAALAEAILSLDDNTLKSMGIAGRQRVAENFTMERLHREMLAVYRYS